MQAFLEHHGYESPTAEGTYHRVYEAFDETLRDVAEFLNARPEEVALTQSTGDGVSRIANAIQWDSGDTVVRTDLEHPTAVVPWNSLERDHDLHLDVLETDAGHVDRERLKDAVAGARLVCVSSISRSTGVDSRLATLRTLPAMRELGYSSPLFSRSGRCPSTVMTMP